MVVQKTEWGQIRWLHIPDRSAMNQTINVGFTETAPGKRQAFHVHYGQEQFIYIIEGEGMYIVNGHEKVYTAGMYIYMEPDCTHETINLGDTVLRELLISNTVTYDSMMEIRDDSSGGVPAADMIYGAIETMRTQVLESLHLPVTVFDQRWSVVWRGKYFPGHCMSRCHISGEDAKQCPCLREEMSMENSEDMQQFLCPYGLTVFHLPIIYKSRAIGAIRGGHILLSESDRGDHEGIYDTPRSSVLGIQKILKQIGRSIISICEFNESKRELMEKNRQIQISEEQLYTVKNQVTNLKINHHYLFNTLNCMADMALTGSRDSLYESIINLAKLFRYTMATDLRFVSMEAELEYLETYLDLQKLRYGNMLEVEYRIEPHINGVQVPFNFLQPIVENAFTHGFSNLEGKRRIRVELKVSGQRAVIRVFNNGSNVDEVTLNRIRKSIPNHNGHGLSLIYDKLQSAYGAEFTMDIYSGADEETCVCVTIPT